MKLGKKATDPGNSRHLGHPALKNRANPGNLPVGHDPGINWTQGPQKAKTPQRPNTAASAIAQQMEKKPAARQQLCCAGLPHPSGRISRFIRSRLMNSRTFSRSGVASALACGSIDARFLARLTAF